MGLGDVRPLVEDDAEHRQFLVVALDGPLSEQGERTPQSNRGRDIRVRQDLAVCGRGAEPGGEVHDAADGRVC